MGEEDACHEREVSHELVAVHDDIGVAENDDHLLIQWPNRIRTDNESAIVKSFPSNERDASKRENRVQFTLALIP